MRFVFVSERLERVRGGIERHAAGLVAELERTGHYARIVRPGELRRSDATGTDWVVFDGVPRLAILRHARRSSSGPRLAIFAHGSFLEEVRTGDLRRSGVWAPTKAYYGRRLFDRTLGRRVFGRFDRWFALTEGEAEDLRTFLGIPRARTTVAGPFLSNEFLEAAAAAVGPPQPSGPYVCAVSRIDRRKNFGPLLEALDGSPYRFVLAGQDRGDLPSLEARARDFPGTRWEYAGTISESAKVTLLRGAAAVVVPSVSEGVPALALEALALGRRVILAGVAYGPDGPGVIRCDPTAKGLRAALDSLARLSSPKPTDPTTVDQTARLFLGALAT